MGDYFRFSLGTSAKYSPQVWIVYQLITQKAFFPAIRCVWGPPAFLVRTHSATAPTPTWTHRQTVLHRDQHSSCPWAGGRRSVSLGAQSDDGAFILRRQDTFWVMPLSLITSTLWKAVKDVNGSWLHSLDCASYESIMFSVFIRGITERKIKTFVVLESSLWSIGR